MIDIASSGSWAVVTGATSGIGHAFARLLADEGMHLVLVARSADRLERIGTELAHGAGIAYRVVAVDLSRPESAAALIEATADLDVGMLVSNAGEGRPGPFLEQDLGDLHRRFTLNATTHLELAHAFGRRFAARGRGGILLVSALGALHGLPNMAHESAAKAYVLNLGEALHVELAPVGVNVMVLLPGNVDTPIIDASGLDRATMPVRPMPADAAVQEAIAAFRRGRRTHIPGRAMRLMSCLLPRAQSIRLNGRLLGRAADALAARESRATAATS